MMDRFNVLRLVVAITTWIVSAVSAGTFAWGLIAPSRPLVLSIIALHTVSGATLLLADRRETNDLVARLVAVFAIVVLLSYSAAVLSIIAAMIILYRAAILWWLIVPGCVLIGFVYAWCTLGKRLTARSKPPFWGVLGYVTLSAFVSFMPFFILGRTYYR